MDLPRDAIRVRASPTPPSAAPPVRLPEDDGRRHRSELGMSSANIYRFFASKAAITEAYCRRSPTRSPTRRARQPTTRALLAPERLRRVIRVCHGAMSERCIADNADERVVHAAIDENWHVIHRHKRGRCRIAARSSPTARRRRVRRRRPRARGPLLAARDDASSRAPGDRRASPARRRRHRRDDRADARLLFRALGAGR